METPDIIKEQVRRLNSDLLTKKRIVKLAKEDREEFLFKKKDYSEVNDNYKKYRSIKEMFKSNLEQNDPDYQRLNDKVKDKQFEVREIEKSISELLADYVAQTGKFQISNFAGEWAFFKVKCSFPQKQLRLFE